MSDEPAWPEPHGLLADRPYRMIEQICLQRVFEAVADRNICVGIHYDTAPADAFNLIHIYDVRSEDLQEVVGQTLLYIGKRAKSQQRRR